MESKKQNKQTNKKENRLIDKEQMGGCQKGER